MNPKDGKAISADLPDAPDEAEDATSAHPGDHSSREGEQRTSSQSESDDPAAESGAEAEEESESHWIGIELKDEEGNPIPGAVYKVRLPDGKMMRGRLDDNGKVKLENIPEGGTAEVKFPQIHEDDVAQQ